MCVIKIYYAILSRYYEVLFLVTEVLKRGKIFVLNICGINLIISNTQREKDHILLKSLALKAVMDHMKRALKEPPIICDKYK